MAITIAGLLTLTWPSELGFLLISRTKRLRLSQISKSKEGKVYTDWHIFAT